MTTDIAKTIAQSRLEALDKRHPLQAEQGGRPQVKLDPNAPVMLIGGAMENENIELLQTKAVTSSPKLTFADLIKTPDTSILAKGKSILQKAAVGAVVEGCHEYHRNEVIGTRFVVFSTNHEGFFDIEFSAGFSDEFILDCLKEITGCFKQVVNSRPMCSTISLSVNEKFITIRGKESDSFVDVEFNAANFKLELKRMIQEQRRTQVTVEKRRGGNA